MSTAPPVDERFGPYGGRFVPETLIGALDELTEAWTEAREDDAFQAELARLLRDFVGRPTPLYLAERLSERVGRRTYLKREDLAHTGAHKINNAVGQALLAKRMGKTRIIAETGAGQHGVATATACALLGLDCVVYMGTEDIRRQAPNVERMNLLGAKVEPVDAGARTLKEAVSAAIRDWVATVADTHYIIGSAVGPAPFPALVRDLQRVIGDEARSQAIEAEGVVPGARHRLRRRRLQLDRHLLRLPGRPDRADRRRGRGRGHRERPPRRVALGRLDRRPSRRDVGGAGRRAGPDPRGPLGLGRARLPGRRPRARPPSRHRPRPLRRGHRRRRGPRVPRARPAGGDHPRARALATPSPGCSPTTRRSDGYDVLCLSGRGDKDMEEATAKLAELEDGDA